jgi:DNA-binding transcriptional MerR regulator
MRHATGKAPALVCTSCGTREVPFAPSGRCEACERAIDAPERTEQADLRQIGAVAALVGLSLRTVRHYEDAGLVLPAGRTPGGFRLYDDEAVDRLRLIMKMKPLGFTLEEMRLLIEARSGLQDPALSDAERDDYGGRVAMFAAAAAEKCAELRKNLRVAEAFAATLKSDAARFHLPIGGAGEVNR